MYGDLGNKLVLEAKRSVNLSELPLYQADTVKEVLKEIADLDEDATYLSEFASDIVSQCQLFTTHLSMRRNKRCLLAYEKVRLEKIKLGFWSSKELSNLNPAEQDYYKSYETAIRNYSSNLYDLDLQGDLQPPQNIFIDVRVLKNGGEIQTEYGSFNLIKNSQFYVRKSDVERLIQQGYMEEL